MWSSDCKVVVLIHDDIYIIPPARCSYNACVTVPPEAAGLALQVVPGGKYAVLPFRDTYWTLVLHTSMVAQIWLPQSGYLLDAGGLPPRIGH